MAVSRQLNRTAVPGLARSIVPTTTTYTTRRFASGPGSEPPRSQSKPAHPGETKTWVPIAAAGAGLGAVFFYMMAKPNNVPKAAHATGRNLPELSSRPEVDPKTGKRMGTWRSD